ncbi:UDP-glycosyltransferase 73D1-like [Impatiens glandulifera]|uniref:UDP-glycosyltransferase 73D1-like n=1 Tax=Impatiens glandulifera TaxID=253017 RepID=UPI001FB09168|nr:UDP-glycosyltransferase 73D1-like [Impatiens glandulifera]
MTTSQSQEHLHFVLIPMMSQSYLIPIIDFAKLLSKSNLTISIITTPITAHRYQPTIDHARSSGHKIQLIPLPFPSKEAGLPEGCESMDSLTSLDLVRNFFIATYMLQNPIENLIASMDPPASCIITTNTLPWVAKIAQKFNLPRFIFHHISSFAHLCSHQISLTKIDLSTKSDTDPFLVPGLPDPIHLTRAQLPDAARSEMTDMKRAMDEMKAAEISSDGVIINSFDELELRYAEGYSKVVKKVWCVGPVGRVAASSSVADEEHYCLKWLNSKQDRSVIYVCFGSLCHITTTQLIELGLGLESSNKPFIWIIRKENNSNDLNKWLKQFEERNTGRGLVIKEWAPQVMILNHKAVGGFLTHCGWNSVMEGVCAGVVMITWPMFAEQFYNEQLLIEVLKIGVRVGVDVSVKWGDDHGLGLLVKKGDVKKGVLELMEDGGEGRERRRRAELIGEMAKMAIEEGGSSFLNVRLFIQHAIMVINQKKICSDYNACIH